MSLVDLTAIVSVDSNPSFTFTWNRALSAARPFTYELQVSASYFVISDLIDSRPSIVVLAPVGGAIKVRVNAQVGQEMTVSDGGVLMMVNYVSTVNGGPRVLNLAANTVLLHGFIGGG